MIVKVRLGEPASMEDERTDWQIFRRYSMVKYRLAVSMHETPYECRYAGAMSENDNSYTRYAYSWIITIITRRKYYGC